MSLQLNIGIYYIISYLLSFYFVRILDAHVEMKESSLLDHKGGGLNTTKLNLSEGKYHSEPIQRQDFSSQGGINTDLRSLQLTEDGGKSVPIHTNWTSPQLSKDVEESESIETQIHVHKKFLQDRRMSETTTLQSDEDEDEEEAGDEDDITDQSEHRPQTRKNKLIVQNSRQTYSTMQIGNENSLQHKHVKLSKKLTTELNTLQYFKNINSDQDNYDYVTNTRARLAPRTLAPKEDIEYYDDVYDDETVPYPTQKRSTESHRYVMDHSGQEKFSSRIQRSGGKNEQETSTTTTPVSTSKTSKETTRSTSATLQVLESTSSISEETTSSHDQVRSESTSANPQVLESTSKSSGGSTTTGSTTSRDQTKNDVTTTKPQGSTAKSSVEPGCQPQSKERWKPPQARQALKVIDGDSAAPGQFKYIVYLKFRYKYKDVAGQSTSEEKEATGAIITATWVVTSLHIVPNVYVYLALNTPDANATSYATESLEVDVEAGTVESGVATAGSQRTVARHPGAVWCHPRGKRYRDRDDVVGEVWYMEDVALVHLNGEPLRFDDRVGVIPLIKGSFPGNYLHCELVGFARVEGAASWRLYYAKVSAGDRSYCESLRGETYSVWPKSYHICAYGKKGRRGCFGDSGSALVCNVYDTLTYVGVLNGLWWNVLEGNVSCSGAAEPFTHYVYCGSVDRWVQEVTSPLFVAGSQVSNMIPRTQCFNIFIVVVYASQLTG